MRMPRRLAASLVAAGLLLLGACGDGEDRPGEVTTENGTGSGSGSGTHSGSAHSASGSSAGGEEPAFAESDADTVVEVRFVDFRFEGIPRTVKGPKVFFEAENEGKHPHELEILDASGEAVDELPEIAAGKSGVLAVELEPGTYTIQCLVEEDGKPHADLGMKTTFTVE